MMNTHIQTASLSSVNQTIMSVSREPAEIAAEQISKESGSFHPLELIPFFRRFKRTPLRTFLYTVIFNTLVALFITLMALVLSDIRTWKSLVTALTANFMISQAIGFIFAGVMIVANRVFVRMHRLGTWATIVGYTIIGFGVVQIAILMLSLFPGRSGLRAWIGDPQWLSIGLSLSFLISLMLTFAWRSRFAHLTREAEMARERARVKEAQSLADNANLRALQAQIEPHFLFNTLANVTGLIHPAPDKAKLMLEQFIAYLRATLAATREPSTTLQKDVEMMRNFLAILQVRMGDRLSVRIDVDAAAAGCHIPPMLLQPIVENAIKHGLEPSVEGGEVAIIGRCEGEHLVITVADTGIGFSKKPQPNQRADGGGVGMENVRQRLLSTYGAAATMQLEAQTPRGAKIILTIPKNLAVSN